MTNSKEVNDMAKIAKLCGTQVFISDKVYDVVQGEGTVVDTTFGEIRVRFTNGMTISFDNEGNYGGVRRLYWHNPVVIDPPKEPALWNMLVDLIRTLHKRLGEIIAQ